MEAIKRIDAFEQLTTRAYINARFDKLIARQKEMLDILERLDQERVFTREAISRLEVADESHDKEIKRIKDVLRV